jgi:hypothetical protein
LTKDITKDGSRAFAVKVEGRKDEDNNAMKEEEHPSSSLYKLDYILAGIVSCCKASWCLPNGVVTIRDATCPTDPPLSAGGIGEISTAA